MRILSTLLVLSLSLSALTFAQSSSAPPANGASLPPAAAENSNVVVIPADTKVPIVLKQTISTKNTREGDAVYAETTFPVVVNDRIIIPAGTYVQGRISHIERAGRVKGRAEVLMHFTTLIYPSGYTVMLPGALQGAPGADKASVKDSEGTVREDGPVSYTHLDVYKRQGFRLAHCAFRHFDVAAALGYKGTHEGGGVVLDLFLHHVIHLAAKHADGMGRARIGTGRHGGDVCTFQDEKSGGSRATTARSNVEDHRHGRCQDFFDNVASRVEQPAGRADLDQHRLVLVAVGFLDGAADVLGGDGLDGVVQHDLQHFGPSGSGEGCEERSGQQAVKSARN